jgi:hypothetical protein
MTGWLLADLMLLLFIVGLGSDPTTGASTPSPTPVPTRTAAPSPTPSPSPSPTPSPAREPMLSQDPVRLVLDVDFSALMGGGTARDEAVARLEAAVNQAIADHGIGDARAGMVIIWSGSDNPGVGVNRSKAVQAVLPAAHPRLFGDAVFRAYWNGSGNPAQAELEVFLLE